MKNIRDTGHGASESRERRIIMKKIVVGAVSPQSEGLLELALGAVGDLLVSEARAVDCADWYAIGGCLIEIKSKHYWWNPIRKKEETHEQALVPYDY